MKIKCDVLALKFRHCKILHSEKEFNTFEKEYKNRGVWGEPPMLTHRLGVMGGFTPSLPYLICPYHT